MAVYRQKDIGNQAGKHLDHEPMAASGNKVIHLEVPLPPGKEALYLPAQLVYLGDLFGSEVEATGGSPVGFTLNRVTDQPQRDAGLIHPFTPQQNLGIRKNHAPRGHRVGFQTGCNGVLLDADNKMFFSLHDSPPE